MVTPAEHRRDLAHLTELAAFDINHAIKRGQDAEKVRDGLLDIMPRILAVYGSAAATLGADFYDETRDASRAKGRFTAEPVEPPDATAAETLARWAVDPLYSGTPDWEAFESKLIGGTRKAISNTARQTVIGSLRSDPQGAGWRRIATSECDFCQMLAGRGAVYSADTADFSAHDHCKCVAAPVFGAVRDVKPYVPSQRFRTPADREANNANVREYLADGKPGKRTILKNGSETSVVRDIDAERTTEQLQSTLASLENSLAKFESAGARARVDDLRRKIHARTH